MSASGEQGLLEEAHARRQNQTVLALLTAIFARKRWILLGGVLGAALGLALGYTRKPWFSAQTTLLPPSLTHTSIGSAMQSTTGMAFPGMANPFAMKSQADSFVVMLGAWPIEDALVHRFHLAEQYHTTNDQDARQRFAGGVAIASTKEGFVTITVRDKDPKMAAAIANAYVDEARNYMKDLALTEASQRRLFYERELAVNKENLVRAESDFKTMQQKSHMLSVDSQTKAMIESASQLRSQITAREVELQRLRSYSTENNPQVQIAESEVAALRGQLARMESGHDTNSFIDTSLSNVPSAELDFVRASRELKYQEGLYDLLVKQYEASKIDEASDAPLIQVIEPAFVPHRKAGPHRTYFLLGGFVFGLVVGLLWVLVSFWRSMLSPEDRVHLRELRQAARGKA